MYTPPAHAQERVCNQACLSLYSRCFREINNTQSHYHSSLSARRPYNSARPRHYWYVRRVTASDHQTQLAAVELAESAIIDSNVWDGGPPAILFIDEVVGSARKVHHSWVHFTRRAIQSIQKNLYTACSVADCDTRQGPDINVL